MKSIVSLGSTKDGHVYLFVELRNGRLSISGVEGPWRNGGCKGHSGQIISTLDRLHTLDVKHGVTPEFIEETKRIWERWHLNDMRAGTVAQEEFLRNNPIKDSDYYTKACEALAAAGLNPDPSNGYKYGHAWLMEPLPQEVYDWISSIPNDAKDRIPSAWAR